MKNLFKVCFVLSFLFILACGSSTSTNGDDDGNGEGISALSGNTFTVDPSSDLTGEFTSCPVGFNIARDCDLNEATEIEFVDDDTVIVYFEDGDYETGDWVYVDEDSFDTTFDVYETTWDYTITGTTILMEDADAEEGQQIG